MCQADLKAFWPARLKGLPFRRSLRVIAISKNLWIRLKLDTRKRINHVQQQRIKTKNGDRHQRPVLTLLRI